MGSIPILSTIYGKVHPKVHRQMLTFVPGATPGLSTKFWSGTQVVIRELVANQLGAERPA